MLCTTLSSESGGLENRELIFVFALEWLLNLLLTSLLYQVVVEGCKKLC